VQDGARFRATTSFTLINFEGLVGLVMHFELYAFECILSERPPRTRERSLINRRFHRAQCFFFVFDLVVEVQERLGRLGRTVPHSVSHR